MNGDLFVEHIVKEKLHSGECILVISKKDFSPGWSALRLITDPKDPNKPLIEWTRDGTSTGDRPVRFGLTCLDRYRHWSSKILTVPISGCGGSGLMKYPVCGGRPRKVDK